MENIHHIQKEQLVAFHFQNSEVLPETVLRQKREFNLNRAMILSNLEHIKAKITFKDKEGQLYQVETTVWAVTKEFVLLKGGIAIPVQSIVEID